MKTHEEKTVRLRYYRELWVTMTNNEFTGAK